LQRSFPACGHHHPLAAPDLAVALDLAGTAKRGAIENVRQLASIKDQDYLEHVKRMVERAVTSDE